MSRLLKSIQYLLYLFVFLLPWQTRWIYNWGFTEYETWSLYGTEILLWLIVVLSLIFIFKNKKLTIQNLKLLTIVLFLAWLGLSAIWAMNWSQSLYYFKLIIAGVLLFLILQIIPFDKIRLMWAFVAGAVIQSWLGIYQFFSQSVFASKWLGMAGQQAGDLGVSVVEGFGMRWLRAYGSLPHPNILAGYLVAGLLMALMLYLYYSNSKRENLFESGARLWVPRAELRVLLLGVSVLMFIGLFLTFSRGAWIGFVVGVVGFWLIQKKPLKTRSLQQGQDDKIQGPKPLLNYTIIILLITALLIGIFYQPFITRLKGTDRLEIKSQQERISLYNQSFEVIKDNWLLGVGAGNYVLALGEKYPSLEAWEYLPAQAGQPVHNLYLMILSEIGVVGLILFIGIIIFIFQRRNAPWRASTDVKNLDAINRVSTDSHDGKIKIILIALLVIGLFDHYLWTLWSGIILFWLIAGLCIESEKS